MRTPKFQVETITDGWQGSTYRLTVDHTLIGELCLLLYALTTSAVAIAGGDWLFAFYLLLYVGGFGLMIGVSLWQARPAHHANQPSATPRRVHRSLMP
ncbi:MAG: hypothetical protein R2867_19445 [Caldilineaceae bacterium]